jgi:hypothetical protein
MLLLFCTLVGCVRSGHVVDCLRDPRQQGYIILNGLSSSGAERNTTCAEDLGYSGTGQPIMCTNGTWTTAHGCDATVLCEESPTQAGYEISSGDSFVDSSRTVLCAEGYEGNATSISCAINGVWTNSVGAYSKYIGIMLYLCSCLPRLCQFIYSPDGLVYIDLWSRQDVVACTRTLQMDYRRGSCVADPALLHVLLLLLSSAPPEKKT